MVATETANFILDRGRDVYAQLQAERALNAELLAALQHVGLVLSEKFKSGRVRAADEELWAAYSHIINAVVKATGGKLTAPTSLSGGPS